MGPLEGIRIIDLTQMIAGPYCTQMLADMGADVIKVEEPSVAAGRRTGFSPAVRGADGQMTSFAGYWLNTNRNKRAITLNLRSDSGRSVLADLIRKGDVVVENFTDHTRGVFGITEEWGKAITPEIIWASLTGFGRTGPDRARGSFDLLAQARGGFLSITGNPEGPPTKAGNSLVDYLGGLHLAVGILAAVRHKERTGQGQAVDISLLDSVVPCLDGFPMWYSIAGVVAQRTGNFHPLRLPGYSIFPCSDGYIAIGGSPGPIWTRLCEAIARPDLAEQPDLTKPDQWEPFFERAVEGISDWTRTRTRDEVGIALDGVRVPNEPVRELDEIWSDPQLIARGMFYQYDYPPLGPVKTIGSPLKFSETPVEVRMPPPGAGEHNWEVLSVLLGYTDDQIAELAANGTIESYA